MNNTEPDIEGNLITVHDMPLAQVILLDEDDGALAHAIRRVRDEAERRPHETIAAFQNFI